MYNTTHKDKTNYYYSDYCRETNENKYFLKRQKAVGRFCMNKKCKILF